MEFEDLAPLKEAVEGDSPDFTAEEAASAIETYNLEDFVAKVFEFVSSHEGPLHQAFRKKFERVNYHVVILGEFKAVFKMGWLH